MNVKVLVLFAVMICGCQKSRADYRDDIARSVCQKMQTCSKIGEGARFANSDDCQTKMRDRYNDMWSAKKCEQRIDARKFAECKTRALTNACDGNLLDGVSFRLACGAGDVCTAEPPSE